MKAGIYQEIPCTTSKNCPATQGMMTCRCGFDPAYVLLSSKNCPATQGMMTYLDRLRRRNRARHFEELPRNAGDDDP